MLTNTDPLMPKFSADSLPCGIILGELFVCQRRSRRPTRRWRLPSRQRLVPHLRISMP